MRAAATGLFVLCAILGQGVAPAVSFGSTGVCRDSPGAVGSPPVVAQPKPISLAASAYKAPDATAKPDTTTPAATPPAGTSSATGATPPPAAASSTTSGAAVPAASSGAAGSSGAPAAGGPTTGGATTGAPASDVYKPPSVEVAPGGITIYRGSGSN
jgi:hypothetical protein